MFILMFSLFVVVHANETNTDDYVDVKSGETVPFDGKLFTNEAIAKILSNHKAEKDKIKVESDFLLEKTKLDLNLKYDILQSKTNSEIEMYKTMISVRDEELKKAAKKDLLKTWGAYGAFILGSATSIAIFYSVNHD